VTEPVKEGWYEDPADRHEYRWFSAGVPTDLVKDGSTTSRDSISITDAATYQSVHLEQPPDDGPLLHKDDAPPPRFELVNIGGADGMGYAGVINTAASPSQPGGWSESAGAVERIVVFLPILATPFLIPVISVNGLPPGALLAPAGLSFLLAVLGRWRRRRRARRFRRPATGRQRQQRT
jgi:hypothetical protein